MVRLSSRPEQEYRRIGQPLTRHWRIPYPVNHCGFDHASRDGFDAVETFPRMVAQGIVDDLQDAGFDGIRPGGLLASLYWPGLVLKWSCPWLETVQRVRYPGSSRNDWKHHGDRKIRQRPWSKSSAGPGIRLSWAGCCRTPRIGPDECEIGPANRKTDIPQDGDTGSRAHLGHFFMHRCPLLAGQGPGHSRGSATPSAKPCVNPLTHETRICTITRV